MRRRRGDVSWHVRRSLLVPSLERLLEDPELAFREPDAVLKEGRSSTVVAWGSWVVKRVNQKRWRNRVLDRFRPGRAPRALRTAFRLEISSIPAAPVAAAGQRTEAGLVTRGYLVSEWIQGARHADAALAAGSAADRRRLLQGIAGLVARIHDAGLSHRDLKAGNVLVTADGALRLVDLDGLREVHPVGAHRAARDLARLVRDLRGRIAIEEEALLLGAYVRARAGVAISDLAERVETCLRAARRARPGPAPRVGSGG
jgi:tRNA A-37 threonylcarbamoyl transferase component Bud32